MQTEIDNRYTYSKNRMRLHVFLLLLMVCCLLPFNILAEWRTVDKGLEFGVFSAPIKSEIGDSKIRILRIDPQEYSFELINATWESPYKSQTAKQWSQKHGLIAAINASMYKQDHLTSVSYMKNGIHVNNVVLTKDNSILAFNRTSYDVPQVKLIDRQCDGFHRLKYRYDSMVQSIRMISCKGKNVWNRQKKKWSAAIIAQDNKGRILFIHVRSPYTMHDLINMLREMPLNIERAMYAEGGPEAQLYINSGKREYEFIGSFETGFYEKDDNHHAWSVPNVIGIRKKSPDERVGQDYYKERLRIRSELARLKESYLSGENSRDHIIQEAESRIVQTVGQKLLPYWYDMEWDYNGHSEIPQQGKIACGYLVTNILRDVGFKIDRIRLAQQPSTYIIKSLVGRDHIKKFSNMPIDEFVDVIKNWGKGLYIVGLDLHVGFVLNDSEVYFIHSTYVPPRKVLKEIAKESLVLEASAYRIVGKLTPNHELTRKWLVEEKIKTIELRSVANPTSSSCATYK
jgi:hypothetical protein